MIKLSGLLEYSMGSFLCLRGFASYKMLSEISKSNIKIQRDLIEKHKGEMAEFLNAGQYRFFPEVILSTNLTDGTRDFEELNLFHASLQSGQTWNKTIGNYQFNISRNATKNILNKFDPVPRVERMYLAHLKFDEAICQLTRIDGNHRLSAAAEVNEDFLVPFCLLLFRNPQENDEFSRAIFHNINAKQIPLRLEENLKVILEGSDVFSDEKLLKDPSFGWPYYLARKTSENEKFEAFPFISLLMQNAKYSFLCDAYDALLKNGALPKSDEAVEQFCSHLPAIENALQEAKFYGVPQNMAVIGAIAYYKLTDSCKYQRFLPWVTKYSIAQASKIHMEDLLQIFDKVYDNMPKSVFMSMQFSPETENTFQTVKDVRDILKREDGIEFNIIKVDEHKDGYSDEIYHRIVDGIQEASLVIADLSYGNKNVHHEIGYAQGVGKKVLLLYQTREGVDSKKEIGSNVSMHDQVRYKNQTELRPVLLRRIRHFFGISTEH